MTSNHEDDLEELKLIADTRKFEIGLFWSRSLFFWGFTAVAVTAYGAAYAKGPRELQCAAACAGIICSLVWTLTNRGSKYWQENWEKKASSASVKAFQFNIFEEVRDIKRTWWNAHFSVSALATVFSDFTLLVWIALAANASLGPEFISRQLMMPTVIVLTVVFAFYAGLSSWRPKIFAKS